MNQAEELFARLYFPEGEYIFWKLLHSDQIRIDHHRFPSVLSEFDTGKNSIDDKPSRVVVYNFRNQVNEYSISWSLDNVCHRSAVNGPASIEMFRDGRVREWYYEFGKRVKKPMLKK